MMPVNTAWAGTAWIVLLVLLALGLMASLALFVSVKRDLRAQARRENRRLEGALRQMQEAPRAATPPPLPAPAAEPVYIPLAPRSGLNLSRRVQATRLLRRGEGVEHVAAALSIPRREVELLIRVEEMVAKYGAGARI